jgi:hypothetical protein
LAGGLDDEPDVVVVILLPKLMATLGPGFAL